MRFLGAGKKGFQPGMKKHMTNRFLRQEKGRIATHGLKKLEGKKVAFAVNIKGFTEQQRPHKVIRYHSHLATYGTRMPVSAATRLKESIAHRGKKHPHEGHTQSAETRAKISAGVKRYDAAHPSLVRARNIKAAKTRARNKAAKRH